LAKGKKDMAVKGIRDTEKVAVGAIRTAIQTWLAPELKSISERLTHVEARLDGLEKRMGGLEKRIEILERRIDEDSRSLRAEVTTRLETLRSELGARFDAVRADLRRLDTVADFRERLASLEAKFAQQG
jgi:chromosome segregation ATPase